MCNKIFLNFSLQENFCLLKPSILLPGFVITDVQNEESTGARTLWKLLSITSSYSCYWLFFFSNCLPCVLENHLYSMVQMRFLHYKLPFSRGILDWFIHSTPIHPHSVDWALITVASDWFFSDQKVSALEISVHVIRTLRV